MYPGFIGVGTASFTLFSPALRVCARVSLGSRILQQYIGTGTLLRHTNGNGIGELKYCLVLSGCGPADKGRNSLHSSPYVSDREKLVFASLPKTDSWDRSWVWILIVRDSRECAGTK